MKLKTVLTAGLLTLGAPLVAQANLNFDTNTSAGVVTLDAFDWAQNSFLAKDGQAVIANYINNGGSCDGVNCDFTVYTHGTLNGATLAGTPVWSPTFSGDSPVEVTFVLSFTETLVGLDTNSDGDIVSTFAVNTAGPINFEMYFDENPNADALTGSGYSDGTLILFGDEILDSAGSFTITTENIPDDFEDLDQAGADGNLNDYDGQLSIAGNGSQGTIEVGGLVQDNNFFKNSLAAFGFDFSNLSQELPFTNVDPSDCFTITTAADAGSIGGGVIGANGCDTNHVDGTYEQNEGGGNPGYVPVTSDVNGFPTAGLYNGQLCNGTDCPDFVAQTDPNSGVQVDVPEPGTLAITGLGLLLLGFGRRRAQV